MAYIKTSVIKKSVLQFIHMYDLKETYIKINNVFF